MEFEWDEAKRQAILEEREIDILDAARMLNAPDEIELWPDPRWQGGEARVNAIGRVDGVYYDLTYAVRGDAIRLITVWKLNEKSKRKAQARYARRAQRHV